MRTSHKLCLRSLIVLVALGSVACGSAAASAPAAPSGTSDYQAPVPAVEPHRLGTEFVLNDEVEQASEEEQVAAHEPPVSFTMKLVDSR